MKIFKNLILIVILGAFVIACNGENNKKTDNQVETSKELSENLKNVEVRIKGMTCEIGCARLIQSKLYKADGIKFAKVSFADSLGIITYDANRISDNEIKNIIQKVAGGDLYKVTAMVEVASFKEINSQK